MESKRAGSGETEADYCETACGQHWYSINAAGFAMLSDMLLSKVIIDLALGYMQSSEEVAQAVDGEKTRISCDRQTCCAPDMEYSSGSVAYNLRPQFEPDEAVKTYPYMASFVRHAFIKWQSRRLHMLHSQKRLFRKDERKVLSQNSVCEIRRVVTDWEVSLEKAQSLLKEILALVAYAR